jgi:hypothetical protein
MLRFFSLLLLVALCGCVPTTARQQLPKNCRADASISQLLEGHWLSQGNTWRMRQSTLLEIGTKKIPLEGFLRLDTKMQEARLVAMNEMGVVLFDLLVTRDDQQLKRAIPQLQKVKGLAAGIAQSLRQIFLQPQPRGDDHFEQLGYRQKLWRNIKGGYLRFIYDCSSDLRTVRLNGEGGDWRVVYNHYQPFGESRLPKEIVLNDYRHTVKLSLWIREVKQEK